jgi:hypothetical protein
MKEDLYLLNEIMRKGLFEFLVLLNDPTLVWKMSPEIRIELDGMCRVSNSKLKSLKSLNICKVCS